MTRLDRLNRCSPHTASSATRFLKTTVNRRRLVAIPLPLPRLCVHPSDLSKKPGTTSLLTTLPAARALHERLRSVESDPILAAPAVDSGLAP